ncbi:MAG TPA: glutamate-1-semialdehyde 2,1-aminomutase [Candidatus Acidoferrales bacterium]|jgi:glutamate-1-semialdehyde 2,1-aminomutase|nr:glutamate-1-semialdehyde 2,1-aminomutase [Candidatus Acidoferrales bacterium]
MTRERPRSKEIFKRNEKRLVGGVNSPVRAFRAVGGAPFVAARGEGARVWDADGNAYLDYVCSWGALILGHANPAIAAAIADQARRGTSFGMTTELEIELAEKIASAMPSIEKIRFVSSGTEATMSAVRLARGFTGRDLFLKFEGCYHGHADGFLSQAGSGLATLGISASPGVPEAVAALTVNVAYNDISAVEKAFQTHKGKIAAVIVEPVAANMGVVLPAQDFLDSLRDITLRNGSLLIFDEVITGFRLAYSGAQAHYRITPDLTTLGKIIGGGLPVAAYGGRREIMDRLAPLGDVYQAGTLSGNPLAMRAGIETLKLLQAPKFYEQLDLRAGRLAAALRKEFAASGVEGQVQAIGSLMTLFFTSQRIQDYAGAKKSDTGRFGAFFRAMLDRGVLLAPSQFEALFVSAAHTDADIDATVQAARESLKGIASAAHSG